MVEVVSWWVVGGAGFNFIEPARLQIDGDVAGLICLDPLLGLVSFFLVFYVEDKSVSFEYHISIGSLKLCCETFGNDDGEDFLLSKRFFDVIFAVQALLVGYLDENDGTCWEANHTLVMMFPNVPTYLKLEEVDESASFTLTVTGRACPGSKYRNGTHCKDMIFVSTEKDVTLAPGEMGCFVFVVPFWVARVDFHPVLDKYGATGPRDDLPR